jgi:hypothetical protein
MVFHFQQLHFYPVKRKAFAHIQVVVKTVSPAEISRIGLLRAHLKQYSKQHQKYAELSFQIFSLFSKNKATGF